MVPAEILLLIGGTLLILLGITGFVLTQRDSWRIILLLSTLLGGLNIGVFIWAELLEGWDSFRLFLFWLTACLPPLVGLGLGALLGYAVNWRIERIKPRGSER